MKKPNEQPRSRIWQQLSFAGVLVLGFVSGWIIQHSKLPQGLNQPKYQVSYGKDTEGRDTVIFRDWSGSVIVVPALASDRSYDLSFGRTPDGGSLISTKDLRYTDSPWMPLYKYDVAFGRGVSDGNAIVAVREWGKTNGPWIAALRYRVNYERDNQGNITVKFGDWFKTNAALTPILNIPAHE